MKSALSLLAVGALSLIGFSAPAMAQSASGASSNNSVNVGVATYGADIPSKTTLRTTGIATATGSISVIECGKILGFGAGFIGGSGGINIPVGGRRCDIRQGVNVAGALAQATGDRRYVTMANNLLCDDDLYGRAAVQAGIACPPDSRGGRMVIRTEQVSTTYVAPPQTKKVVYKKTTVKKDGVRKYNHIDNRWE